LQTYNQTFRFQETLNNEILYKTEKKRINAYSKLLKNKTKLIYKLKTTPFFLKV